MWLRGRPPRDIRFDKSLRRTADPPRLRAAPGRVRGLLPDPRDGLGGQGYDCGKVTGYHPMTSPDWDLAPS